MAESNFKTLSDLMPQYNGNPKLLNMFINDVDHLLELFHFEGAITSLISCLIKSKLSGSALDAIAHEKSLNTWPEIKDALVRRLGDPRNEIQVMQDLSRTRRHKTEDSEAYGKRLREILDTLYSVGNNPDKSYYEKMVIEQYVSQLEFHVSLGVRISQPATLESAIMAARQEETRLACNPPPGMMQYKARVDTLRNNNFTRSTNTHNPQHQIPHNVQPQPSWPAEQRAQPRHPMLQWHQRPNQGNFKHNNNSGTFRNSTAFRQQNIPQHSGNQGQKVSDVTMRSLSKPQTPNLGQQDLYYLPQEPTLSNPVPQELYFDGGECSFMNYTGDDITYDPLPDAETEVSPPQDFPEDVNELDTT